jgi:NADPH-dependent 2,4-dienoyl-CoA reductase/sulfur reductase-like enzyme/nitrite reductase/ring-hydroxylating ferredoxin subunit
MAQQNGELEGPDLTHWVDAGRLEEGRPLLGHAGGEPVILVRSGDEVFAVGATCTHYGGPLAKGLVAEGTVRCPLHHARFDLRSGRPKAPALDSIGCYEVVTDGARVRVGEPKSVPAPRAPGQRPESVVIVGGGAAGAACAETLRGHGYDGPITVVAEEGPYPVDRPNLSKDYLAGDAPEEWLPVRPNEFYARHQIDWRQTTAQRIDPEARAVQLEDGEKIPYDALLLATGSTPRLLPIEGIGLRHVHTLRSSRDSDAICAAADAGERAVVIGASFIGLEVAASLTQRGLDVTVVAPTAVPLQEVLGLEVGRTVQVIHEEHGVRFHMGHRPLKITADHVVLDDRRELPADLVVVGVGVEPRVSLAAEAGLDVDDGVLVDSSLRTSADGIYAAGDVARFPRGDGSARIEHWVVAERQGQAVARVMLGSEEQYDDVPFFWSRHFDTTVRYVGHGEWEEVEIVGSLARRDATVAYRDADGRIVAVATLGRRGASLQAELALEKGDSEALEMLLR